MLSLSHPNVNDKKKTPISNCIVDLQSESYSGRIPSREFAAFLPAILLRESLTSYRRRGLSQLGIRRSWRNSNHLVVILHGVQGSDNNGLD